MQCFPIGLYTDSISGVIKRAKVLTMPITDTSFKEGNTASMQHGARSYLARTEAGKPITGGMAAIERSILIEVETDGARGRVEKQAARFAAAAEMYWQWMQESPENFHSGLKAWGWLAGAEIRAWRDFAALRDDDGGNAEASKILASYKVVDDDNRD